MPEDKNRTAISFKISPEESKMVDALKGSPYFMNISEFLRASIVHIYNKKVVKSKDTKENPTPITPSVLNT